MSIRAKHLIYFELFYCLFAMQWLTYFGVSNIKVLVPDIINIILLFSFKDQLKVVISEIYLKPIVTALAVFAFASIFASTFGNTFTTGWQGLLLAIWDIRIIFRPYLFIVFCVMLLDESDVNKILEIFYKLQFVNVIMSLYQYYVQGYWMDNNGGIFSVVQGCNKYSNVFCCVMLFWVMARYMQQKSRISQVVLTTVCSVVIAIYAELKFLFIEMILIVILCVIFSGRSSKKIRTILIGIVITYFGLYILSDLFPSSFEILTDSELLIWYSKDMSYSNTEISVNRLSGFEVLDTYVFNGSFVRKMFGNGWGATGQIPLLGLYSSIILEYSSLNYIVFTYSWIYAELGMTGIICFYSTMVVYLLTLSKNYEDNNGFITISKIAVIVIIVLTIYDSSWVTEGTTFLCAFAMSAGLITIKEQAYGYNIEPMQENH